MNTANFLSCLKIVCKAINKKNPINVLTNVLLSFENNILVFCGTKNDVSITTSMETNHNISQKILVNAYDLLDIMSKIKDNEFSMEISENHFIIKTSICTHNINRSHTFFPMEPWNFPEKFLEINNKDLISSLDLVNIKTENLKIILKSDSLSLISFDRRRLAINLKALDHKNEVFFLTINRKTFTEIIKIFPENSLVKMSYEHNRLLLSHNNTNILLKTIHEGALAYERLLKLDLYEKFQVEVDLIRKILDNILIMTDGIARFIKINFSSKGIRISGFNPNSGLSISVIPMEQDAVDIEIHINGDYLLETVRCFEPKTKINIYVSKPPMPLIINQNECNHIIMPIQMPMKS